MKKNWMIIAIVAVIGVVIWWIVKKKRNEAFDTSAVSAGKVWATFPLMRGKRGENVAALQRHLNEKIARANAVMSAVSKPDPLLVVDGIFGEKTEKAMLKFYGIIEVSQGDYGVIITGVLETKK